MEENPRPLAPEALLAQGEWVRRVARALVLDEHRAEDLAQQVWVKALENPPRVRLSVRAWLGTVLRNAAADLGRRDGRRRRREESAARAEALPAAETVVARAETLHRVSAAALSLREPYRTVILLRYFEDLAPSEIARRLDVPLETVRTRLRRGLEILREGLDGESGGDRKAWIVALLPLPRLALPPAGSGAWAGGDAAGRVALGAVQEIAAMTARNAAAVVLGILISVGAALWFLRDLEPDVAPVPGPDPGMSAMGGRRGGPKPPAPPPADLGTLPYVGGAGKVGDVKEWTKPPKKAEMPRFEFTSEGWYHRELAGMVVLRGRVVDAETGAGIGALPLQTYSMAGESLHVSATTGADGSFEVRGTFKGAWSLGAGFQDSSSDYGRAHLEFKGAHEGDLRVEIRRGLTLEGRIEDPDGRPYAGEATVLSWSLDAKGKKIPATQQWVFTPDGRFRLRGLDPGPHLVRASAHAEPHVSGSVTPVEAGARDVVVRLARAAAIEGRIVAADGNPVAVAGKVRIHQAGVARFALKSPAEATVPGDGTFRTPLLDPGTSYDLEASGFEGFETLRKEGVAGGTTDVVLVLAREK